jgi:hypothetical protein
MAMRIGSVQQPTFSSEGDTPPGVAAGSGPAVEVTTTDELLRALREAASVDLAAYELRRDSDLVRALAGAADHGTHVRVRVDGRPYGAAGKAIAQATQSAAVELRRHGVTVDLVSDHSAHLKAAVVDGRAYLDDRNWTTGGHDTVLTTTDAPDVALVRDAIDGRSGFNDHLATSKQRALDLETDVISAGTGDWIDVESESLGTFGGPYTELKARATAGAHIRLIVSDNELRSARGTQERAALRKLADVGVEIRVGASRSGVGNEKLCVAGDAAWAGSANASFSDKCDADWGLRTSDASVVSALQARFEANWSASRPYVAA